MRQKSPHSPEWKPPHQTAQNLLLTVPGQSSSHPPAWDESRGTNSWVPDYQCCLQALLHKPEVPGRSPCWRDSTLHRDTMKAGVVWAKCSSHCWEGQSQLTGFPAIIHCLKLCLLSVKNLEEPEQDGISLWESQKALILLPLLGSPRSGTALPFCIHTEPNEAFYRQQQFKYPSYFGS